MHADVTRARRAVLVVLVAGDRHISRKRGPEDERRTSLMLLTPRITPEGRRSRRDGGYYFSRRRGEDLDPTPGARSRRLGDYAAFPCTLMSGRNDYADVVTPRYPGVTASIHPRRGVLSRESFRGDYIFRRNGHVRASRPGEERNCVRFAATSPPR